LKIIKKPLKELLVNEMQSHMIIAIDGPAGSGKSTTARLVAKKLGFIYVDTGAMYRAVTLSWLTQEKPNIDEFIKNLPSISLGINAQTNEQQTFLNGIDVSKEIRGREVTDNVSYISSIKTVREKMVEMQRNIGNAQSVVMDGRDIGTAVFPKAHLKIFMVADIRERAVRRWQEMKIQSMFPLPKVEDLMVMMKQRDEYDSSREIDPLRQADDAILLDTSNLTIEDQAQKIIELANSIHNN
jgi:cytidylate kinase